MNSYSTLLSWWYNSHKGGALSIDVALHWQGQMILWVVTLMSFSHVTSLSPITFKGFEGYLAFYILLPFNFSRHINQNSLHLSSLFISGGIKCTRSICTFKPFTVWKAKLQILPLIISNPAISFVFFTLALVWTWLNTFLRFLWALLVTYFTWSKKR